MKRFAKHCPKANKELGDAVDGEDDRSHRLNNSANKADQAGWSSRLGFWKNLVVNNGVARVEKPTGSVSS